MASEECTWAENERFEKSALVSRSASEKEAMGVLSKEESASKREERPAIGKEELRGKEPVTKKPAIGKEELSREEPATKKGEKPALGKEELSKEESVSRKPTLSKEESAMWHRRLGHAHPASLKSLIDGFDEIDKFC